MASSAKIISTLKLLQAMGCDDIVAEQTRNCLLETTIANSKDNKYYVSNQENNNKISLTEVKSLVKNCYSLKDVYNAINVNDFCNLKALATNTVIKDGVDDASLMIIGEAPGVQEDELGLPFVGRSGMLLDKMLNFIGCSRNSNSFITNSVFWRPPGNRKPDNFEISICLPFVEKMIELVNPKVLLLLGATPANSLLANNIGITSLRGKWYKLMNIPTIASFHPAYLLRQPLAKKEAWYDFLLVQEKLNI